MNNLQKSISFVQTYFNMFLFFDGIFFMFFMCFSFYVFYFFGIPSPVNQQIAVSHGAQKIKPPMFFLCKSRLLKLAKLCNDAVKLSIKIIIL